ncbi:iron chelate uptake ABC transporter family permease subunit [Halovulum sp. GXIMD14793]
MVERRFFLLGGLLAASIALFLLWGLRAPFGFILSLRAEKLAVLILVGAASGAATVIFQTIAANRLLTPSIVGFDSLFVFLQTMLVLILGGVGYAALPALPKFAAETVCMMLGAMTLFGLLFRKGAEDITRMILTGVILGILLRGLAGFAQRLLEPSEFAVVQQASIASFNAVEIEKLWIAGLVMGVALVAAWLMSKEFDVATLGRTKARTLGLGHDRLVLYGLGLVAILVSTSTALVGSLAAFSSATFLGLLAASLGRYAVPDSRHAILISVASLIGAIILVLGQAVFERLLGLQSALSIVVNSLGGFCSWHW